MGINTIKRGPGQESPARKIKGGLLKRGEKALQYADRTLRGNKRLVFLGLKHRMDYARMDKYGSLNEA